MLRSLRLMFDDVLFIDAAAMSAATRDMKMKMMSDARVLRRSIAATWPV